jgi:HEAT repeat protein
MADLHNLFSSHPDINSLKERKDFRGLIRALKHRDPQVQFDASAALSDLGSEGVTHLIDGLTSRSRDTRLGIIEALGEIKDRSAVDPLIRLLKDRDIEIRWEAALALGEIGDTRAVQPLKEAGQRLHLTNSDGRPHPWRSMPSF